MPFNTEDALSNMPNLRNVTPIQKYLSEMIQNGLLNQDRHQGLMTGFSAFDAHLQGLQGGDLVVLAGSPGTGKTPFALNLAEQVAVHQGKPVIFVSTTGSAKQLSFRLAACMGRVDSGALRAGKSNDQDHARFTDALERLFSAPLFFIDDIFDAAKLFKRISNITPVIGQAPALVIVDNLHLLNKIPGGAFTALHHTKRLARKLNAPVLLTSNVSSSITERADKRPRLHDLLNNEAIEMGADLVLGIYRDDVHHADSPFYGMAELSILKWANGGKNTFPLTFIEEWSRFGNPDDLNLIAR